MPIKRIDTKAVHKVDVSGTEFSVRAFNWMQAIVFDNVARHFRRDGSLGALKIGHLEELRNILAEVTVSIKGIEDPVIEVLDQMVAEDIGLLAAQVNRLSTLTEDQEKN